MKVLILMSQDGGGRAPAMAYPSAEVRLCDDREEALDVLRAWRPDILLLDPSSAPSEFVIEASAYCPCVSFVSI